MDYKTESLKFHQRYNGKIEIVSKFSLKNKEDLAIAYTPGVAEPCLQINQDPSNWYSLTSASTTVAVVSDGSAVLGLGNIGSKASLPVMEGKSVLFKEFADVNAFPIVSDSQDSQDIINTVKNISSSFGGINLEDISAPKCFEIEEKLKEKLDIPVFHDDQHGTAIVVLAGLINSLKITGKDKSSKIVINGAGAAGIAIAKLLHSYGFENIIVCDSKGIISRQRNDLSDEKLELLTITNLYDISGDVYDAIISSDIFIGVSKADILKKEHIESMNFNPIVMAMANPVPEIFPEDAKNAGAEIVATGRSDYPNQLNNVLAFPGIFKGALEVNAKEITQEMKIAAADGIANLINDPTPDKIIPKPLDKEVAEKVASSVKKCYHNTKKC